MAFRQVLKNKNKMIKSVNRFNFPRKFSQLTQHFPPRKLTVPPSQYNRLCLAIFDLAGTLVDRYSIAPSISFLKTFSSWGIPLSMSDARKDMGVDKLQHLEKICANPKVREAWIKHYGSEMTDEQLNSVYQSFIVEQMNCLSEYSQVIPGSRELFQTLRDNHYKIGVTTGYPREMAAIVEKSALKQGLKFDFSVASGETPRSRPFKDMIFKNMQTANMDPRNVQHLNNTVKIDDTCAGIEEAHDAKVWSVGIFGTSSYMEMSSIEEANEMKFKEFKSRILKSKKKIESAKPHLSVYSVAQVGEAFDKINLAKSRGGVATDSPEKIASLIYGQTI